MELRQENLTERVDRQLVQALQEVQRLKELRELLDKNPETQRILELMRGTM